MSLSPKMEDALLAFLRAPQHTRSAYPGMLTATLWALTNRGLLRTIGKPGDAFFPHNALFALTPDGVAKAAEIYQFRNQT